MSHGFPPMLGLAQGPALGEWGNSPPKTDAPPCLPSLVGILVRAAVAIAAPPILKSLGIHVDPCGFMKKACPWGSSAPRCSATWAVGLDFALRLLFCTFVPTGLLQLCLLKCRRRRLPPFACPHLQRIWWKSPSPPWPKAVHTPPMSKRMYFVSSSPWRPSGVCLHRPCCRSSAKHSAHSDGAGLRSAGTSCAIGPSSWAASN